MFIVFNHRGCAATHEFDSCTQCYDGASNMVGCRKGVATQLASKEKRAVLTHCYDHALNLAVGDSMKQSNLRFARML